MADSEPARLCKCHEGREPRRGGGGLSRKNAWRGPTECPVAPDPEKLERQAPRACRWTWMRHHEPPALQTTGPWRRASSVPSSLPHSGNQGTRQSGPKTFCVSV